MSRDECQPLYGLEKQHAKFIFSTLHYAKSCPSGKSHYFVCHGVFFCFSIPANNNISKFLLGKDALPSEVWELSRMWAKDGHEKNALTRGLSLAVRAFKMAEPWVKALVSYADPNVGHSGGIYRAASWVDLGQCEEGRYYRSSNGQVVSRRKFHSGKGFLKKADILALGYVQENLPGKYRFAKGLTAKSKKLLSRILS